MNNFGVLAIAVCGIILCMIFPVSPIIVDLGLAFSFAISVLVVSLALYAKGPLEFSSFPIIIVLSLIVRLALNVSSTKLIISEGHSGTDAAGDVIEGFADFVMGGDVVLGIIIFSVILIVNYIVITKGASRMAEVGARFALDGMPGKQLAIDSDLSAGAISHDEARLKREKEQQETTFFGSLDGASKFVKGDAIAGLLIVMLNIFAGLLTGVLVHGLSVGQAFETYAILTVGDGLVTQLPAVIISIASAILLSRGGLRMPSDVAILDEVKRYPVVVNTVAILMLVIGFIPGMPFFPFFAGAALLFVFKASIHRRRKEADDISDAPQEAPSNKEVTFGDVMELDELHLVFSPDIVGIVLDPANGLESRISNMRIHIAEEYGVVLPEIRLTDDGRLPVGHYAISVQGVEVARNQIIPGSLLAISTSDEQDLPAGDDVLEPVYGARARWISREDEEAAALTGATVVSAPEVLATHLLEVVKENFDKIFSLRSLKKILDEFVNVSDLARVKANERLLDEYIPDRVPLDVLLSVMKSLLAERVSIRNLSLILEGISEARGVHSSTEAVCEHVRQKLGFQIVAQWRRNDGTLPLIQLAPAWEEKFKSFQIDSGKGQTDLALPPDEFGRLASGISEKINSSLESGTYPAVITSSLRRKFIKTVLLASGVKNPVLSFEEIGVDARPALVGMVEA